MTGVANTFEILNPNQKSNTMNYENELESLGYTYYTPNVKEHQNIRKEYNPVAILLVALLAMFGVSVWFILFYLNGQSL